MLTVEVLTPASCVLGGDETGPRWGRRPAQALQTRLSSPHTARDSPCHSSASGCSRYNRLHRLGHLGYTTKTCKFFNLVYTQHAAISSELLELKQGAPERLLVGARFLPKQEVDCPLNQVSIAARVWLRTGSACLAASASAVTKRLCWKRRQPGTHCPRLGDRHC